MLRPGSVNHHGSPAFFFRLRLLLQYTYDRVMRVCRCILMILAAGLPATAPAFSADDTEAPKLTSLRFTPASIDTSKGPAEVTVSFTASDDVSGVVYLETAFVDSLGASRRPGSVKLAPALSAAHSLRITFPQFSPPGPWTLSHVLLVDAAGNTSILDSDALRGRGFPTSLQVMSAQDTASPKLTALDFSPAQVDTSAGPADVKVNYTATDDLSGVNYIEVTFVSPSGVARHGSAKFAPAQSVSNSITVTFPRLSEAGSWTLGLVFLADAAGNTLVLDKEGLARLASRRTLDVKSASDTTPPKLTDLRFTPEVNTSVGPAAVTVNYTATDDLSGVVYLELGFGGPSGAPRQNASAKFDPARSVSNSIKVTFPRLSEAGEWTLDSVYLADAAGNTLVLDRGAITALGFPTTLQVKSTSDTIPPSLTGFHFTPEAIDTSGGPATVKAEFSAKDNLSGVRSFEVVFVGPSGSARQVGSRQFSPANEATDSVSVNFPASSEPGTWKVGSILLTDDAGNTLSLDAAGVSGLGFRTTLDVK